MNDDEKFEELEEITLDEAMSKMFGGMGETQKILEQFGIDTDIMFDCGGCFEDFMKK